MALISKVHIANMALGNLGATSTIETFTEASAEAQQADLWYDYSRLQALEAFNWSFARKRLTLASHGDDPPDIWGYRYQYPADCVIIRKLQNPITADDEADAIPYEIEVDDAKETKTILTNLEDAVAIYTFDLETTALFTPLFVELLASVLAYHMAMSITGDKEIRRAMQEAYSILLLQAPTSNANEQVMKPIREAEWIRGRV